MEPPSSTPVKPASDEQPKGWGGWCLLLLLVVISESFYYAIRPVSLVISNVLATILLPCLATLMVYLCATCWKVISFREVLIAVLLCVGTFVSSWNMVALYTDLGISAVYLLPWSWSANPSFVFLTVLLALILLAVVSGWTKT